MPSRGDRSPLALLARGLLVLLLILAAIPAYLILDPSWRPLVVRSLCALIVVAGSLRVIRRVLRSPHAHAPSVLDAPAVAPAAPGLDERFLRLRDELLCSTRSRRYFDLILWPRLVVLAGGRLAEPARRRRILRDGPSLDALQRLIGEVEKRA
jgi:hypothetical protein